MDGSATNLPPDRHDDLPRRHGPALVLGRQQIASLMSLPDYVTAVEAAFRAYGTGQAEAPPPIHIAAPQGTFHVKSASLMLDRPYVAVKLNGNFPANPVRSALPTIQGVVVLCDGTDGTVLAAMDSIEITSRRTGGCHGAGREIPRAREQRHARLVRLRRPGTRATRGAGSRHEAASSPRVGRR